MMNPIAQATSPPPQFNLEGIGSPQGKRFSTAAELEAHLNEWVEATPTRTPPELRKQAADIIRTCWLDKATNLNLGGMRLSSLPDVVFEMNHLQLLNLSDNQLTRLPDTVRGLTALKTLNLARNPLQTLPRVLPELDGLMLTGAGLTEYPRHLFELPMDCMIYLRDVRLDRSEESWLRDQISRHPHGPTVDRLGPPRRNPGSRPDLRRTISDKRAQAPSNTVIGFAWNSPGSATTSTIGSADSGSAPETANTATIFPLEISPTARQRGSITPETHNDLPGTRRMTTDTRLTGHGLNRGLCLELRSWLYSTTNEETEDKRRLAARAIQTCIDRKGTNLNIGDLALTELPEILWTQTQITQLHLGGNRLNAEALADIGKLEELSHLLLPSNGLNRLPPLVATLSKLRVLDLSGNAFAEPPAEIAHLPRLEFVYLHNNPLQNRRAPAKAPANCYVSY